MMKTVFWKNKVKKIIEHRIIIMFREIVIMVLATDGKIIVKYLK